MTERQERRLAALGRIVGFGKLHPEDFPAGSKAGTFLEQITAAETAAKNGGTGQSLHGGHRQAGTATKAEFFEEILDDMREISRTARALAMDMTGLDEKFRIPRGTSHETVLAAARAFLEDATPLSEIFIEYQLPADFLEDLAADIAAFEAADEDQGEGLTEQVGATRSVAEAISIGATSARKLDPILRNLYRRNAERLAEWISASHVERPEKKRKAKETPKPV
jgi:hypothetical protein